MIQHWRHKAYLFRFLSAAPGGLLAHYLLQRFVSKSIPRSDEQLALVHGQAERLADLYTRFSAVPLAQSRWLEFGTGRELAHSIAMSGAGVRHVTAIDLTRLATLQFVSNASLRLRNRRVVSWVDLEDSGVTYLAPADARKTHFLDTSIDCVTSWNTMEHIPKEDVAAIHREAFRVLKPGGLSIQKIDYGDHYRLQDHSISLYNFLTIPSCEWRRYQSDLLYQSRLRHSEHLALMREVGFDIVHDEPQRDPIEPEILARIAPEFRGLTAEDLFTAGAVIIGRKT